MVQWICPQLIWYLSHQISSDVCRTITLTRITSISMSGVWTSCATVVCGVGIVTCGLAFQLPVQPLTDSNPVQTGRASKDGRLMRTLLIAPHLFAPYWSPHTHSSISCSSITLLRHSSNSVRPLGDKTWHQCWPRFTPWPGVSYPERPVVLTTELKREQCNRTVDNCPAVASLRTFCLKPGAKVETNQTQKQITIFRLCGNVTWTSLIEL